MVNIKCSGGDISLYDSIHNMPIYNYENFSKQMMFAMGMPTSPEGVLRSYQKLAYFINKGNKGEGLLELSNLSKGIFHAIEAISLENRPFYCLIHKIGDEKIKDFSDSGFTYIRELLKKFEITQKDVSEYVENIKKKLMMSLNYILSNGLTGAPKLNISKT